MTPEEWRRVRSIFETALASDPADRAAIVDRECAGHPALRNEVMSLLAAHDDAGDFIESPAYEVAPELLDDGPPHASLAEGAHIGPYLVRHEIGHGGMGIVYLADDTRLMRRVALKGIGTGDQSDKGRERLRQEARAAAALSHPNIATVYAIEEIDGELYLASEYVPGPTLRSLLAHGPLPLPEVVDVAAQLARALAAAHAIGIVHRDVKPENIVRTAAGVVKVLDFGVARMESFSGSRVTLGGAAVGTPAYMAPEQLRHENVDFRTDLFALGLVIYEIACGSNPFEGETATASMARILEVDPPPLSRVCATGSPALDRIVATCLCKNPNDRYASTLALLGDLERLQTQLARDSSPADSRQASVASFPSLSPSRATPRSWWEIHQLVVSVVYALMIYPAWRARIWLAAPWKSLFFLAIVAAAVIAVAVRLHLVFAEHSYPAELSAQRTRTRTWTRGSDMLLAVSLLVAALTLAGDHAEVAALFLTVSIAATISMLIIEPATARAAFRDQTPRS